MIVAALLFWSGARVRLRPRRAVRIWAVLALLIVLLGPACDGGARPPQNPDPGPSPGPGNVSTTSPVSIVGASGALKHSTVVTVTVQ